MRAPVKVICLTVAVFVSVFSLSSFLGTYNAVNHAAFAFPYQNSGLTERQAAAHLLNRFTYGATPGQIDAVLKIGLENWFNQQLQANMKDDSLTQVLDRLDALKLTNAEVLDKYPNGGQVLRMAVKDGVIKKDSAKVDQKAYRAQIAAYLQQKGMKPLQELERQFIVQKILRATYTNNQLQEVMTDFWFNHFNVSLTKNDCAQYIPAYERDVIRPNALSKFNDILLATAKSPAMLFYLDNFSSMAPNTAPPNAGNGPLRQRLIAAQANYRRADTSSMQGQIAQKLQQGKKAQGLNENYAREVMELHTLGVDGGYTQQDVTQAARVLTGWTIYPMGNNPGGNAIRNQLDRFGENTLAQRGFVHDGDFLFTANRHDNGVKTVMGTRFANGGYQEGVQLLSMLAHNTATAKFIVHKIAVRFVNDNPPQSLLDKMTQTYLAKDGDIKQILITMVSAPEFWSKDAVREKTKSPFELAIGAARALHAEVRQPYQLYAWIDKMGEKIYSYQAPTGFPDKGQYWINTGALLNRMNFGLALASNRIPGIYVNLAALNNNHEPESAQAALVTYAKLIMPERDMSATIKQLSPMLNDPNLIKKIDDAATKTAQPTPPADDMMGADMMTAGGALKLKGKGNGPVIKQAPGDNTMLAQVVGVIIGSPEFQRR
jgi:uncharacterized protein (DUF1800 family)